MLTKNRVVLLEKKMKNRTFAELIEFLKDENFILKITFYE